jgi:hypothetical protein
MKKIAFFCTFLLFSIPVFGFGNYILCWFNCLCSTVVRETEDKKTDKVSNDDVKKLTDLIKKQTNEKIIIENKEEKKN